MSAEFDVADAAAAAAVAATVASAVWQRRCGRPIAGDIVTSASWRRSLCALEAKSVAHLARFTLTASFAVGERRAS